MSPKGPPETPYVWTEDVVEAAGGISSVTVWKWVKIGLLPKPTKIGKGRNHGVLNRWPREAIARVKRVRELQAAHKTLAEIAEIIAEEFEA